MGCSDLTSLEDYEKITKEMEMILDNIPGLVFYKDTMNNLIRVNKFFADAHHSKKEELAGKNCFDLYPQIQAQAYWEDDLEVIKSGVPKLNIEEPWETDEGKKWVSTNKIPYIDDDGNIKGIVGFSVDITERKKAEIKIKELKELYRLITECAKSVIFTQDMNLKFTYVSPEIYDLLGYTSDQMMNETITKYNTASSLKTIAKALKEEFKAEKMKIKPLNRINRLEVQQIHKDGHIVDVEIVCTFIRDDEGKPTGIFGVSRDITERKKIERKLKKYQNQLEALVDERTDALVISEKKFQNIIENISDAIIETELGGKFKYASPQIQNIIGYTPDEVIGLNSGKRIHPDDFERFVKTFKRAIRSGERISIEYRVRHKEGYYVPVSLRGHIFKEKDKYRHIGLIGDISEKIIAEQKLRDSEKKYKDLFENSPHPIIIATIDGKIIDCNSTTVVVFGIKT